MEIKQLILSILKFCNRTEFNGGDNSALQLSWKLNNDDAYKKIQDKVSYSKSVLQLQLKLLPSEVGNRFKFRGSKIEHSVALTQNSAHLILIRFGIMQASITLVEIHFERAPALSYTVNAIFF